MTLWKKTGTETGEAGKDIQTPLQVWLWVKKGGRERWMASRLLCIQGIFGRVVGQSLVQSWLTMESYVFQEQVCFIMSIILNHCVDFKVRYLGPLVSYTALVGGPQIYFPSTWIWVGLRLLRALGYGRSDLHQCSIQGQKNVSFHFLSLRTLSLRAFSYIGKLKTTLDMLERLTVGALVDSPHWVQLSSHVCWLSWSVREAVLDSLAQLNINRWPQECHMEQKNHQWNPAQSADSQNYKT